MPCIKLLHFLPLLTQCSSLVASMYYLRTIAEPVVPRAALWLFSLRRSQVPYGRKTLQVRAVQQGVCLVRSPQGSHQDPLGPESLQVPHVRHHVHHQRQPAAPHHHPQRPAAVHVPLLPEDLQVVAQLQEAHEDTQVCSLQEWLWGRLLMLNIQWEIFGWTWWWFLYC